MKTSFALQTEINSRIQAVWGDACNSKRLQIEFSTKYPEGYHVFFYNWAVNGVKAKIDGYFGEYDVKNRKVILYLPVLSGANQFFRFKFEHFFRIVLYFEVGQWICSNINIDKFKFKNQAFIKTGIKFRNFISLMFAYQMIKFDQSLINCFVNLIPQLDDDYTLCLKFLEQQKCENQYLPGLELLDLLRLLKKAINTGEENITNEYMIDNFDKYITKCIEKEPFMIEHFKEVMTEKQKDRWKHLSKE